MQEGEEEKGRPQEEEKTHTEENMERYAPPPQPAQRARLRQKVPQLRFLTAQQQGEMAEKQKRRESEGQEEKGHTQKAGKTNADQETITERRAPPPLFRQQLCPCRLRPPSLKARL